VGGGPQQSGQTFVIDPVHEPRPGDWPGFGEGPAFGRPPTFRHSVSRSARRGDGVVGARRG